MLTLGYYGLPIVVFFLFDYWLRFGFNALSSSNIFDNYGVFEIKRFAISCIFYNAVCCLLSLIEELYILLIYYYRIITYTLYELYNKVMKIINIMTNFKNYIRFFMKIL